jgi:formate/nitrite transporter FocA (FNT family)
MRNWVIVYFGNLVGSLATVASRLIQIVTGKVRESRTAQARQTQKAQQPARRL